MKTYLKYLLTLLLAAPTFFGCNKDEISGSSIFGQKEVQKNEFDRWLDRHYVQPYNIRFEYRMPDRETHFNYWVSPPPVDKSIEIAKLIKYSTLDALAELMSNSRDKDNPMLFARMYFPKVLFLVGSFEIQGSGTVSLASAENGLQINILGAKFFDRDIDSERIAGTMLHEYAHILDGTYAVPEEFNGISGSDYIGNQYTTAGNDYFQKGFVSNYARSSIAEDIAVMVSNMITGDEQWWQQCYESAGPEGAEKIQRKRHILTVWLADSFGVDVNKWNVIYHRRLSTLDSIDWTSLDD